MDATFISALSALGGATIGGLASFGSSWLTQQTQFRFAHHEAIKAKREALYTEFIEEARRDARGLDWRERLVCSKRGGQAPHLGTQTRIDPNLSPDICRLTLGIGRNGAFLPVAMPAMSDRLRA